MGLFEVYRGLAAGFGNGFNPGVALTTMAQQVVMDWRQAMVLDGRVFQVRAGTVTTPFVGDVPLADAAAEAAIDAGLGTTIIPCDLSVSLEAIGGTVPEIAAKSVGAVHTAQTTVFVALPLLMGGGAATSTSGIGTAGGVTVAAELNTTTREHFHRLVTAIVQENDIRHSFKAHSPPPVLVGPAAFYVQIGSVTTGSTYMLHYDFIELPTTAIS
ncbi:hypothetical protein LCGC14_2684480 [marine sediment metagenome]|uniref:Uncharacterized protein n=1 Tax=marine sediment metagenome TaxID=412755 RepID=A0A0F8ZKB6_9ZZZZ